MLAELENTTVTEPLFATLTDVVIPTVRVAGVVVGATLNTVPLTATSPAAMEDGIVVPDGNWMVIVLDPAVSAPPEPTLNAMVYWARLFWVEGSGVTLADVTVLCVISYTLDSEEPFPVAATSSVYPFPAVVGFLIPAADTNVTTIEELPATPSPSVIWTMRLAGVVVTPLTATDVSSSVTVTLPELMEEGTVVPLGNVTVIVSPLLSPVVPITKLSAY